VEAPTSLKAALLDFDGTLVDLPVNWDQLREQIARAFAAHGVGREFRPLYVTTAQAFAELEARGVPPHTRANLRRKLNRLMTEAELDAAGTAEALPGSRELLECLRARGWKTMIQTSNSVRVVHEVWERLSLPPVDAVVGRESARRPKPDPQGVRRALRQLGVRGSEAVVVGDGDYDVVLGRAIGAKTVRVRRSDTPPTPGTEADIDVESLHELIGHS
jgi:beta-phosphoglucomutase-like phosphatase (HAD superfamily)